MKKLLIKGSCILMTLPLALGCGATKYDGFVLRGTFTGPDSTELYLVYADSTGKQVMDSTLAVQGKFEFRGGIKTPTIAEMMSSQDWYNMTEKEQVMLFLAPAEMTISVDGADLSKAELTGSPENDTFKSLDAKVRDYHKQARDLYEQSHEAKDEAQKEAFSKQMDAIGKKVDAINLDFMRTHPSSFVSAFVLDRSSFSFDYPLYDSLYNSFSEDVRNSSSGRKIAADLELISRGEPGKKARLLAKEDLDGNMLDLWELNKTNYVLIDFWASWCVPCRKGNPHLKELYKKYGPKGLVVVCVGDNDSNPDELRKAIKEDNVGEFKHVLRGMKFDGEKIDHSEDLSDNFGVKSLPSKFLVDKNGTILLKCGSDTEALDAKLKEIFGF